MRLLVEDLHSTGELSDRVVETTRNQGVDLSLRETHM